MDSVLVVMASILIVIILLLKLIFKNKLIPTWHYYIWLILILRLLLPFSLESFISIFNTVEPFINGTMQNQNCITQPTGITIENRKVFNNSQIAGNMKRI